MSSLEGYSFNSGNILALVKEPGPNDFSSLDRCHCLSCPFQKYFRHDKKMALDLKAERNGLLYRLSRIQTIDAVIHSWEH